MNNIKLLATFSNNIYNIFRYFVVFSDIYNIFRPVPVFQQIPFKMINSMIRIKFVYRTTRCSINLLQTTMTLLPVFFSSLNWTQSLGNLSNKF